MTSESSNADRQGGVSRAEAARMAGSKIVLTPERIRQIAAAAARPGHV